MPLPYGVPCRVALGDGVQTQDTHRLIEEPGGFRPTTVRPSGACTRRLTPDPARPHPRRHPHRHQPPPRGPSRTRHAPGKRGGVGRHQLRPLLDPRLPQRGAGVGSGWPRPVPGRRGRRSAQRWPGASTRPVAATDAADPDPPPPRGARLRVTQSQGRRPQGEFDPFGAGVGRRAPVGVGDPHRGVMSTRATPAYSLIISLRSSSLSLLELVGDHSLGGSPPPPDPLPRCAGEGEIKDYLYARGAPHLPRGLRPRGPPREDLPQQPRGPPQPLPERGSAAEARTGAPPLAPPESRSAPAGAKRGAGA